MLIAYEEFVQRADGLRAQIAAACARAGRDPATVELLAVTKTHPAAAADYAARYGLRTVGENRVQEGAEKRGETASKYPELKWDLIGHLQSNKAKVAVRYLDRIQTVDSEKLLVQLDRAGAEAGKTVSILLQINAGNDPAKFGADVAEAPRLLESALGKNQLHVDGLMTIAPLGSTAAETAAHAERTFAALRTLRDDLAARFGVALPQLSMGMTGDLAIAVAAGSTILRVGTALYGARDPVAGAAPLP